MSDREASRSPVRDGGDGDGDRDRPPRSRSASGERGRPARDRSPPQEFRDWREVYDKMVATKDIREGDLDKAMIEDLERAKPEYSLAALKSFFEHDKRRINNPTGFVKGILARLERDGLDQGGGDFSKLPKDLRYKLEDYIDSRRLERADLDARLISRLNEVPAQVAEAAVERFGRCDFAGVRSRIGFLMGIIKKLEDDFRGGGRGGAPYGGGGGYPPRREDYGGRGRDSGYPPRRDDYGGRRDDRRDDRRGGDRRDEYRSRDRSRSPRRDDRRRGY